MSVPEYLEFIDPHLCLNILDFISKKSDISIVNKKKEKLFKTLLFDQQNSFIQTNPELVSAEEKEIIRTNAEGVLKMEEELKSGIVGFLNLIENCRRTNDFDTSNSLSKKIVSLLLKFIFLKI
jgi:hypothetical protein